VASIKVQVSVSTHEDEVRIRRAVVALFKRVGVSDVVVEVERDVVNY
jgi:hypothetical protein